MAVPKNKQITLTRGDACQITFPDGRMMEVSSTGKVDLVAPNGNAITFCVPDIGHGETDIGVVSSLIGDRLTKH